VSSKLQTAIENVYDAFKDITKPQFVDGCPCCIDEKGISILLAKPLRELSPDDLAHYAASVFLTVGSVGDFFYFLPRILEILALNSDWWPDPEVVTRALHNSGFHTWPPDKSQAVANYFDVKITSILEQDQAGWEVDSWICALGRLHVDLNPFLRKIASNPSRLIEYYEVNSNQLNDGKLSNGFWDDAPKEHQQIVEWFQSAEIKKAIELAYGLA
ncbi:MAG TPA: hypothetical protein VMJ12_06145, partial [Candidatus Acidoferrales bacterium]|nr:hypothetical protein [Candidatus Acidoferrales bacterium]